MYFIEGVCSQQKMERAKSAEILDLQAQLHLMKTDRSGSIQVLFTLSALRSLTSKLTSQKRPKSTLSYGLKNSTFFIMQKDTC